MENCRRGGGNHGRKIAYGHSPTAKPVSRRQQLSRRGRRATRYPRATRQNQSYILVQYLGRPLLNPIFPSGASQSNPTCRDVTAKDSRSTTPVGGQVTPCRELLASIHPVLQCSIPTDRRESDLHIAGTRNPIRSERRSSRGWGQSDSGGAVHTRYPKATHWHEGNAAFPCRIPRAHLDSNPVPPRFTGRHAPDESVRNSGGGRRTRCQRDTHRRHPAFLCSIPGGCDFQADL